MGETEPDTELDEVIESLQELEEAVDHPAEVAQVRETLHLVKGIPGSRALEREIQKYTTRDMAQTLVGGILLSLPLLVEDGVFDIAAWLVGTQVLGLPIFLIANVAFIVTLTVGLLFWADIRTVTVTNPLFGVIPRRLVGVLVLSFLTATFLVVLWGRHAEADPGGPLEVLARITVIWAAAAFGGALGDILPGESRGRDVTRENLSQLLSRGE